MTNRDTENKWHLKKEIQLGHLITTLTVLVSVVIYAQKLEQRIAIMENQITVQRDRDERQDVVMKENIAHVRSHLDRMEAKLDRLIERKFGSQQGMSRAPATLIQVLLELHYTSASIISQR